MNDVAYRILGLKPRTTDIGRPFAEVLKDVPDVVRILAGAFELSHLPNRAELRLKTTGKVIGYTLSQVRDDAGEVAGATLFFKDLTRVEQLEERERLRDRLAALGEMAAAIAHEVKNPLAGIEVMAGLLQAAGAGRPRTRSRSSPTSSTKPRWPTPSSLEVLEFVRPIRLQVEHIALADVVRDAMSMAESHVPRGRRRGGGVDCPTELPPIQGDPHQLRQLFTNLLTNAFEALERHAATCRIIARRAGGRRGAGARRRARRRPMVQVERQRQRSRACRPKSMDRIFSPFFTTKPQGSGLGLAIVRKIVDAHDGRIDVGARPGGGTTFRVTLPVTSQQELFE